jgi:predicted nucleic acid-binding protein
MRHVQDPEQSRVAAIEVARVVKRIPVEARLASRATEVLSGVAFVELSAGIADAAAQLEPPSLRTLDAVHLASALSLGDDLGTFVAYDRRLQRLPKPPGSACSLPPSDGEAPPPTPDPGAPRQLSGAPAGRRSTVLMTSSAARSGHS